MSSPTDDIDRLRAVYAARSRQMHNREVYSLFNSAHLYTVQQRQRNVLKLLKRSGFYPLRGRRLLEIGCGNGGVLLEYLAFGAEPKLTYGIDVLPDRCDAAHGTMPHLHIQCADGQTLPYRDGCFDLVMQYTAFSSLLDPEVKSRVAQEMLRVVHKPNGVALWYDFHLNPRNHATRGISHKEIRKLFPDCNFEFHRITLAMPITRHLIHLSWSICHLFEQLKLFNTHYLVAIRPQ